MLRMFGVMLGLLLLLFVSLTACKPIDGTVAFRDQQSRDQQANISNPCMAVRNQAVLGFHPRERQALISGPESSDVWDRIEIRASTQVLARGLREDREFLLVEGEGLEELQSFLRDSERFRNVTFDPNYYVRSITSQGVMGEGHSPSQSPFGASPAYIKLNELTDTSSLTAALFTEQAALQAIRGTSLYSTVRNLSGDGVKLAIFDTYPFTFTMPMMPISLPVIATDPESTLESWVTYSDILGPARDHGLFVASLANQIAPDAQLYLYRVLNEDGIGNVFTLATQMSEFLEKEHYAEIGGDDLPRSVVNLSLSVSCDPASYQDDGTGTFTDSLSMLNDIITRMHEAGVVIVAAAGNEARVTATSTSSRPAQGYPAGHEYVIGVGATDLDSSRLTCYSNLADISVPGGGATSDCTPNYDECPISPITEIGKCKDGVVGLSTLSSSGLAFWAGTSFAAPLVSGLMARWISAPTIASDFQAPVSNTINITQLQATLYITYGANIPNMQSNVESGGSSPASHLVLK